MGGGKLELDAVVGLFAFSLRQAHENGDEALADGGEGELFNDADEAAEARTDDGEDLEGDFGVLDAEGMEVAAGDKGDLGIFNGDGRGRIRTAVEDGELGDGFAGKVDGEDLFAAADGGFEDADFAAGDAMEAGAGLAFREEQFAGAKELADGACGEGVQFGLGKTGEEPGFLKNGGEIDAREGHPGILATRDFGD